MLKLEKETIIPIVLSSDDNYIPQMYVTILSALKTKNESTTYHFFLFLQNELNNENKFIFEKLSKDYNTTITTIVMNDFLQDIKMTIKHITLPTYYRLKMAEILQWYKKAIYLDVDTIICKDLANLYNTDITNYYIAGVLAYSYTINKNNKKYYIEIGLKDLSSYINAGVTLWNLDKIRKENLTEKLCKLIPKNLYSQDQDIINIVFKNNIKILPFKYNLMTKYKKEKNKKEFIKIYGKENIEEAFNDPVIIHYADKKKPWEHNVFLKKEWNKYAKESPFYNSLKERKKQKILNTLKQGVFGVKSNKDHKTITFLGIKISIQQKERL